MEAQIRLDTFTDVKRFVDIATGEKDAVYITDGKGLKVSAKSILGAMYSLEFDNLWCEAENDIYMAIKDFIIE